MPQKNQLETVTGVLLADGWHTVKKGSFTLYPEAFLHALGRLCIHTAEGYDGCAKSFGFVDLESADEGLEVWVSNVFGPLSSVLGIKESEDE